MKNLKADKLIHCAKDAIKDKENPLIVEIGCIREEKEVPTDGFSTYYLAKLAHDNNGVFKSYDIESDNVEMGNKVLQNAGFNYKVEQGNGKDILPTLGPISFLYLDSHRLPAISAEQYLMAELQPKAWIAIDDAHSFDSFQYGKATDLVAIFNKYNIHYTIEDTEPGFKMVFAYFPDGKSVHSLH